LKLSDEDSNLDDIASQVVASSGEEEDEETQQGESGTSSFPQLVMPSIQMPTRRPFTDKGRAMGRLKVLIAGESGVGKTSLIRSIVQLCEDIVHVDPLSPTQSFSHSPPPPKSKSRKRKLDSIRTTRITENHASTKTYPHWWNDIEEGKLRRRRGGNDSILERNLSFIDTPGYTVNTSLDDQNLVLEYVESLMYQNSSASSMEESDLLGLIGGNGGVQVDVVFYLLSPGKN
jgi:septin family protein